MIQKLHHNKYKMDNRLNVSLPAINNNPEEDFQDILLQAIKTKYHKMLADKRDTPSLIIPKHFEDFINTQLFLTFCLSLHTYIREFHRLHHKYMSLEVKMNIRTGNKKQEPLESERTRLQSLERQISFSYGTILLKYSNRTVNADQLFFETLLYLVSKVIKEFFPNEDFLVLQEEINRLFRTQKYNIIQKRHKNDDLLRKYPVLKETYSSKMTIDNQIQRIIKKKHIYSTLRNQKRLKEMNERSKSVSKHDQMDAEERSPIVSVWLASNRHKLSQFVTDSTTLGFLRRSITRGDMEQIVKDEIERTC